MEEIREQMDIANELNDAISQPLGDPLDEDDLEAELLELESENLDEQLLGLHNAQPVVASPIMQQLPTAPSTTPTGQKAPITSDEEAQLRELEASMAFG